MENTRELLAAKQAKARMPPPWQEHDTAAHSKVAKAGGFESESARDRVVDLHQDEMRLQANEGSISDRDRHQQGRRDNR